MAGIEVSSEAVNKMVVDAIMNSAIGATLNEVVSKKVADLGKSYNNPIELEVDRQIRLIIHEIVEEKFKPIIRATVENALTEDLGQRISLAAWSSLLEQFNRYKF
jgi:hypothetical protein